MLHDTIASGTVRRVPDRPNGGHRHWSSARPWRVLGAAAVFTAVFIMVGVLSSGGFSVGGFAPAGTESARVERALAERFAHYPADLIVYVPGEAGAPSVASKVRTLTEQVAQEPGVAHAVSYWTTGAREMLAENGRAALIAIDLTGDDMRAADTAAGLVPELATLGDRLSCPSPVPPGRACRPPKDENLAPARPHPRCVKPAVQDTGGNFRMTSLDPLSAYQQQRAHHSRLPVLRLRTA